MKGTLLVAGTTSDAGKSVLVSGLCRLLSRQGHRVAPFKAQNMALNAAVTLDGGEIGRAQAAQADAAGVDAEIAMNPILIKPTGPRHSQVVIRGHTAFDAGARDYHTRKTTLLPVVSESLRDLASRFDVVLAEGAGGAAEINLRPYDLTNLGLARQHDMPVVIVCDIDRGGAFASLYGTLALMEPADQALVSGFIINRFRGDRTVLDPGIRQLEELTQRPCLGVIPHVSGLTIDAEDSLALDQRREALPPLGKDSLTVTVVRLPHISNFTDIDALTVEPGVSVRFSESAADITNADLVVLPGSKNTVGDLDWLHERGLAEAVRRRCAADEPTLGVCGGYQMLGRRLHDEVESRRGEVKGLDILPVDTVFHRDKTLRRHHGRAPLFDDAAVDAYSIRHGRPRPWGGESWLADDVDGAEGCRVGSILGTSWHGLLENNALRRAFLTRVARRRGLSFAPGDVDFAQVRRNRLDAFADVLDEHLDMSYLFNLIQKGAPDNPFIAPPGGAPALSTPTQATEQA
ncbi:cobyric acid synthase [Haloglycomyces albus]|uniref:cobyric acid synthase n=1 Tax=Haloglycomyces albus TaxID=526067 RepID=UPI00046D3192|nr:cobyric acid synthase [Haloglycomyces albus]